MHNIRHLDLLVDVFDDFDNLLDLDHLVYIHVRGYLHDSLVVGRHVDVYLFLHLHIYAYMYV